MSKECLDKITRDNATMAAYKNEPGAVPLSDWLAANGYKDVTLVAMCEAHVKPVTHASPEAWSALTTDFFGGAKNV